METRIVCQRIVALAAVLVLLAFAAGSPLSTRAGADVVVTRNDDPVPDGCAPDDCSLREAVIDANTSPGHDTIMLGPGTFTLSIPGAAENSAATGDLDVNEDTTIIGAGSGSTTVDAAGLDRAFDIGVGINDLITVGISGLAVQNGDAAAEDGGAMRVKNSTGDLLALSDVELRNNTARRGGGLASGNGSALTLTDVVIRSNAAVGAPSPMNSDGGGLFHCCSDSGYLTVVRARIENNDAAGDGGGVFLCCSSTAELHDLVVSDNIAGFDGGGVYHCCNNNYVMDITNGLIDNNTAGHDGGGFFNCCTDVPANLTNVTLSTNDAAGKGGGVFTRDNEGGTMNLLNATVTANKATAGDGVFVEPGFGELTLTNTIVAGNEGDDCDGNVESGGHNIDGDGSCGLSASGDMSGVDPLLGPLADNGGFSQTHALLAGSPAINNASNSDCPDDDQRGVDRPQGATCDIGAFELEAGPTPTPSPTPTGTPGPGTNAIWGDDDCNLAVAATDALKTLQEIASIPYTQNDPCFPIGDPVGVTPAGANVYPWGDVNCNGALAATDALAILRSIAALSVNQPPGCPEIGDSVTIQP